MFIFRLNILSLKPKLKPRQSNLDKISLILISFPELIQKWIFDEFELSVDCFADISELHQMCEDLPADEFTVADFSDKESSLPVFLVILDVRV